MSQNNVSLDQLSIGKFSELVGSVFSVSAGEGRIVELKLASAASLRTNAPGYEGFSLVFDGPAAQPLEQRIFQFRHDQLGAFELFIVPVGADRGLRQYEVVFNRRAV